MPKLMDRFNSHGIAFDETIFKEGMYVRWTYPLLTSAILAFCISVYYMFRAKRQKETRKRVEDWFETELQNERNSVVLVLGNSFDRSELSQELEKKLKQANLSIKPSEYMGIYILLLCLLTFCQSFFIRSVCAHVILNRLLDCHGKFKSILEFPEK